MRRTASIIAIVIVAIGLVYAVIHRGSGGGEPGQVTQVSVRMKWFYAGTMTGWFAGKEQGYFKDAGIELKINPGGPNNNSVKLVAAGTDKFGVAGADEVLMAREQGIPVVAVAVLFKDTPICFISKKSTDITTPAQWSGRKIEVSYGSNAEVQYRALVKKFEVKNVKEVPYTFNLAPFVDGKVDVSVAYKMDQVVTLEGKGIAVNIVSPKEYGINPYGDVIITTEKTLREQPDLVKRFVQAAVKSFQWSVDNPEEAVSTLVKGAPELKVDNELQVWKATIPFLTAEGGAEQIGVMKPKRWQETMNQLIEFKSLKAPIKLDAAYHNVLTED